MDILSLNSLPAMGADEGVGGLRFVALTDAERADAAEDAVRVINAKHARTPMRAEDLHLIPAVMSTDALDSHFSRMDEATLRHYATDAKRGVPFVNSHRSDELPLGHTYSGEYAEDAGRREARAGIYMARGLNVNGVDTDQAARAINTGTVRDGSVAFYGGRSVCDVCGHDIRDYQKCPHVPGMARECPSGTVATYTVKGARLRHFAVVTSGSNPDSLFSRSALDKTERAIAERIVGAGELTALEDHYRMRLTDDRKAYSLPGHKTPGYRGQENEMKTKALLDLTLVRFGTRLSEDTRKRLEAARGTLTEDDTDPAPVLEAVGAQIERGHADADLLAQFRAAGVPTVEEARRLKAAGEDGRAYREDLVKDALAAGTRAQGESFNRAVYEKLLGEPSRSIEEIKTFRDDWERTAKTRLGGYDEQGNSTGRGGRETHPLHGFEGVQPPSRKTASGSGRNFKMGR